MSRALIASSLMVIAGIARAEVPTEQLAKPPPGAELYTILSPAGRHGQTMVWQDAGVHWSRESINLRGFVTETDQAVTLGADGMIRNLVVRGKTPSGDAAESFDINGTAASWRSQVDRGAKPYSPALYVPFGGTFDALAINFNVLAAAKGQEAALLPSGSAHLERLATAEVGEGPARKTLTAYEILGLSSTPIPIWAVGKVFFGFVTPGLSVLPHGYENELSRLEAAQEKAVAARQPTILHDLLQPMSGPVAFVHAEMFDADAKTFRRDMTVVVDHGRIEAMGPGLAAPAGAHIIDGTGKTLLPGLWDMHQHYLGDDAGPYLLSFGITSGRDPGNNNALTIDRARRRGAGELLSPAIYASSLLDGKSPYTAQLGTAVSSQDEALAAVRRAKADGFVAIKIYGSFNPAWVSATAAEAHRLGLHVHGHVPAGMRPLDAVQAGYDEITHINFVMMQAMPDAVVNASNTDARILGMGRYAGDVDLASPAMSNLIDVLAKKKIAVDPTLCVFEAELDHPPGTLGPAYAPYAGILPPADERATRAGGTAIPKDSTQLQFHRGFEKLKALVAALHAHGVRLVGGTDGSGIELVRELELYVEAGLTPEDALETVTLDAARLVGVDATTGSIAVGKTADMVLVEGDPQHRMGDLRRTRLVMMGGRLMDADALRRAGGFSGRPG